MAFQPPPGFDPRATIGIVILEHTQEALAAIQEIGREHGLASHEITDAWMGGMQMAALAPIIGDGSVPLTKADFNWFVAKAVSSWECASQLPPSTSAGER